MDDGKITLFWQRKPAKEGYIATIQVLDGDTKKDGWVGACWPDVQVPDRCARISPADVDVQLARWGVERILPEVSGTKPKKAKK